MGNEICLIKSFFQISSFMYIRTNKHNRGLEQHEEILTELMMAELYYQTF